MRTNYRRTTWLTGCLAPSRAQDGHPAPFPLHCIEIGNEDQFDKAHTYDERFGAFASAIRARYGTRFQLIATMPVHSGAPDLIDDHYYEKPEAMFELQHKYDSADRKGPKIFIGEWATRTGSPTPNFGAALGDAAWMTGMERNSDLIAMASYAPLLTNVNAGGMQWSTDLIGYNAASSYGSPSYWAQVMFASHLGDSLVATQTEGFGPRIFASATLSSREHVLHLKLVNANSDPRAITLHIPGAHGHAEVISLHGGTFAATNTTTAPHRIQPVDSSQKIDSQRWVQQVPPYTIEVLDIPVESAP